MALPRAPEAGLSGTPAALADLVLRCPEFLKASRIVVGFSGGVDSTVLLHLLHDATLHGRLTAPLHALHVNHMMQAEANGWEEDCRSICTALDIPFRSVRVPVLPLAGKSVEEAARDARHAVFAEALQAGEVLALAQHGDDQVETVF